MSVCSNSFIKCSLQFKMFENTVIGLGSDRHLHIFEKCNKLENEVSLKYCGILIQILYTR